MRVCLAAVLVAAVTATVAACSGSTQPTGTSTTPAGSTPAAVASAALGTLPADEVLARAKAALQQAKSYRITGTATALGIVATSDFVYVEGNATGTQKALGQTNEYIRIGDVLYIRAAEGYWSTRVRLEQLALVINRWVKVSARSPSHVGDVPSVEDMTAGSGAIVVGSNAINGRPVITLKSADGNSTAHVAAQGEPYLLRVEGTSTTESGPVTATFDFSEFGTATATIEAPTGEVVDLTSS